MLVQRSVLCHHLRLQQRHVWLHYSARGTAGHPSTSRPYRDTTDRRTDPTVEQTSGLHQVRNWYNWQTDRSDWGINFWSTLGKAIRYNWQTDRSDWGINFWSTSGKAIQYNWQTDRSDWGINFWCTSGKVVWNNWQTDRSDWGAIFWCTSGKAIRYNWQIGKINF